MRQVVNKTCGIGICPVHGGWSEWSEYSLCDRPCGGGNATRYRRCDNPVPSYGGNTCVGNSTNSSSCNTKIECLKNAGVNVKLQLSDLKQSTSIGCDETCVKITITQKMQQQLHGMYGKEGRRNVFRKILVHNYSED